MSNARRGQDICDRTFALAVRIVKLCQYLNQLPQPNYVLARQLLRAGTSIGANVEEAQAGQSRADFAHKYGIALKEARETRYWLRLLVATELVSEDRVADLLREIDEVMLIIAAIVISTKKNQR